MHSEGEDGWVGVLVRVAVMKQHRLGELNSRHLLLTVLEAGSPEIGVPEWSGSWGEPSSWLWLHMAFSCCMHTHRILLLSSFYKDVIFHHGGSTILT